ncbi:hypothetical protein C815_00352 [Firmicutes bacterium M10-2]|nr:hypothetical protein C815_00352 [Firmicutes bacterium M10-2]
MSEQRKKISKKEKRYLRRLKRNTNIRNAINLITPAPYSDLPLNLAMVALMAFGTAMIASTAVGQTIDSMMTVLVALIKQLVFLVAAYVVFLIADKGFNLRWFYRLQTLVFSLFMVAMIAPFGFAAAGGSHAWIRLGPITIQPSEFGKPLLIVICACSIYSAKRNREQRKSFWSFFHWPILAWLITMILLAAQKDYGTAAIMSGIVYICLMIPSYPTLRHMQRRLTLALVVAVSAVILLFGVTNMGTDILAQTPLAHIATRIENAKNPYTDIYGSGYQPANSLYGIADSNIIGKGFGNSSRKYGYLTQADNDYILAVTIEETGIIGFSLIIFFYAVIEYRLFYYALRTQDTIKKVILIGTGTYLFLHFALNVGGVGALIPMTGIPLLFISSGGSSLIAIAFTLGLCQQMISKIREKEMKGMKL